MKKAIIIITIFLITIAGASAASLNDSLIAWVDADNNGGLAMELVSDSVGINTGTAYGSLLFNESLTLDNNDNYIFENLTLGNVDYFSVSLWINLTDNQASAADWIFSIRNDTKGQRSILKVTTDPAALALGGYDGNSGTQKMSNPLINVTTVHHVFAVYNPTTADSSLWLDGVNISIESEEANNQDTGFQGDMIMIGYSLATPYSMMGEIDEIAVFSRAPTAAEVALMYNSRSGIDYDTFMGGGGGGPPANNTAPVVTPNSPTNDDHRNTQISEVFFNYSDADGDAGNCTAWINYTQPYNASRNLADGSNNEQILTLGLTLPNGTIDWYVNCTDGQNMTQSAIYNVTIDTINPIIDFSPIFIPGDTTYYEDFTTYINITDEFLFGFNFTIFYPDGTVAYNNHTENLTVSNHTIRDFIDTTGWLPGNFTYKLNVSDWHTDDKWRPKSVILDKEELTVDNGLGVKPKNFGTDNIEYEVVDGGVTFEFFPDEDAPELLEYEVKCKDTLYYRNHSKYKGWFVCDRKWIDFENEWDKPVEVEIVNEKKATVRTRATNFYTIGGLNIVGDDGGFEFIGDWATRNFSAVGWITNESIMNFTIIHSGLNDTTTNGTAYLNINNTGLQGFVVRTVVGDYYNRTFQVNVTAQPTGTIYLELLNSLVNMSFDNTYNTSENLTVNWTVSYGNWSQSDEDTFGELYAMQNVTFNLSVTGPDIADFTTNFTPNASYYPIRFSLSPLALWLNFTNATNVTITTTVNSTTYESTELFIKQSFYPAGKIIISWGVQQVMEYVNDLTSLRAYLYAYLENNTLNTQKTIRVLGSGEQQEDARVTAEEWIVSEGIYRIVYGKLTDSNGEAILNLELNKEYRITAQKSGFEAGQKVITVRERETTSILIELGQETSGSGTTIASNCYGVVSDVATNCTYMILCGGISCDTTMTVTAEVNGTNTTTVTTYPSSTSITGQVEFTALTDDLKVDILVSDGTRQIFYVERTEDLILNNTLMDWVDNQTDNEWTYTWILAIIIFGVLFGGLFESKVKAGSGIYAGTAFITLFVLYMPILVVIPLSVTAAKISTYIYNKVGQ